MTGWYIVKNTDWPSDTLEYNKGLVGRFAGCDGPLLKLDALGLDIRVKESATMPLVAGQPIVLYPICVKIEHTLELAHMAEKAKNPKERRYPGMQAIKELAAAGKALARLGSVKPVDELNKAIEDFDHHWTDPEEHHMSRQYALEHVGKAVLFARALL
jgi:hypothetical protein